MGAQEGGERVTIRSGVPGKLGRISDKMKVSGLAGPIQSTLRGAHNADTF